MRSRRIRLLDSIAPPLSIRRQFIDLCKEAPVVLRKEGIAEVARRTQQALARYRETGALIVPDYVAAPPPPPVDTSPISYAEWIAATEPTVDELAEQSKQVANLSYQPIISIVLPVYNPPPDILSAAIESVLEQTYGGWQLCVANGSGDNKAIAELLDAFAQQDERICVDNLLRNLGISGNSNEALKMAQGEFIALMDHDDILAPNLLYEVVQTVSLEPMTDIVYYDEDKLTADGLTREHPWFKPDFSPDLMLSTNLLMHGVFRRALIDEVGGFDSNLDGAQDWDLALRCTLRTRSIVHIPKILYHWRQIAGSASVDAAAKPYAFTAQATAIENHLATRDGLRPSVRFPSLGRTRVVWPESKLRVSIIIPTKDNLNLLRACLESIFTLTDYANYEIVLVDTGSREVATKRYYDSLLQDHDNVKLIKYSGGFNYSRANNLGARAATGDLLLFLNNDTEALHSDWLQEMAGWASRDEIGVVGAKLLRPNGLIQHAGIVMGMTGHGSHVFEDTPENTYSIFGSTEWYRNYHAVTGACMMVSADLFRRLNGFDELYQIGYSDIEFCLRAEEAGYRTLYTPFARLRHHEGGSRGFYLPPSDVLRASAQMLPRIRQRDRNYNRNLSLQRRQPALAHPQEAAATSDIVEIMRSYRLLPPFIPGISKPIDDIDLALPETWPLACSPREKRTLNNLSLLLVTHDLSLSGAPLLLAALAKQLGLLGVRMTLVSPEDGPARELFEQAGAIVGVIPSMEDFHGTTLLTRPAIGPLTYAVAEHDLVLANSIVSSLAIHAASAVGKPSLYWLHESHFGYETVVKEPSVQAALANADMVVVPTQNLVDLYGNYLPKDRVAVVPHGLELNTLDASGDSIALDKEKIHVVCVGSLEPRKGQDLLLTSILKLPEDIRAGMEFHFLGRTIDPAFANALFHKAAGFTNIHFTGNLAHPQIMSYLDAADIFVLSSRDEVLPVSILEAMYHELAIVATRVGGIAEVIEDNLTGILVEFGDRRHLTQTLEALGSDVDLRRRLGKRAGSAFHERFTMSVFLQRMVELIEAVANRAETTDDSDTVSTVQPRGVHAVTGQRLE